MDGRMADFARARNMVEDRGDGRRGMWSTVKCVNGCRLFTGRVVGANEVPPYRSKSESQFQCLVIVQSHLEYNLPINDLLYYETAITDLPPSCVILCLTRTCIYRLANVPIILSTPPTSTFACAINIPDGANTIASPVCLQLSTITPFFMIKFNRPLTSRSCQTLQL